MDIRRCSKEELDQMNELIRQRKQRPEPPKEIPSQPAAEQLELLSWDGLKVQNNGPGTQSGRILKNPQRRG
jgi:hypothetical protein